MASISGHGVGEVTSFEVIMIVLCLGVFPLLLVLGPIATAILCGNAVYQGSRGKSVKWWLIGACICTLPAALLVLISVMK
jgi:hypothetical protein